MVYIEVRDVTFNLNAIICVIKTCNCSYRTMNCIFSISRKTHHAQYYVTTPECRIICNVELHKWNYLHLVWVPKSTLICSLSADFGKQPAQYQPYIVINAAALICINWNWHFISEIWIIISDKSLTIRILLYTRLKGL